MKKIIVFCLLLVLTGCGGGGGGGSAIPISGWTGPVNAQGYPDVKGRYTFTTTKEKYTCTDGSSGELAETSIRVAIQQNIAALTFYNLTDDGVIIYDESQMTGTIDIGGRFFATRSMAIIIPGLRGATAAAYRLDGIFTETGWGGIYILVIYNTYIQGGCTYRANFTGDRFSFELQ